MARPAFRGLAVSGLVLSGGRGTRMGGIDKGLAAFGDSTLAAHAMRRLSLQVVGAVAISANRHLDAYARLGGPVFDDEPAWRDAGPLAGMLAGLKQTTADALAVVPCDAPAFPLDLVDRLAEALEEGGEVAVAATPAAAGGIDWQPTFCLLRRALAPRLESFLAGGGRAVHRFVAGERHRLAVFEDAAAFANLNTAEALVAHGTGDG